MDLVKGLLVSVASLVAATVAHAEAPWSEDVRLVAARVGLPQELVWQVLRAESGGDPRAVSPAGAMGLMQLMPSTWGELRAELRLGDDPFAPADNLLAGATYLRRLYDRYGLPGALAAYNAGPGRYEAYLSGSRKLPAETRRYVAGLTGFPGLAPAPPSAPPGLFAVRYDAPVPAQSSAEASGLFVPRR